MPRVVNIIIFAGVALSLLGGLHYYFWARLVRDTALPPPWRQLATWALLALLLSMPLALALFRGRAPLHRVLVWPGYIWMGMVLLLLVCLVGVDVIRLVLHLGGSVRDPERRLLFRRVLGAAAATLSAGLGGLAMREALGAVQVRELEVTLPRLPRALDGATIVQLTDVHVGPTIGRRFIEDVVRRTNALAADLVVITGDLVDGTVAELADSVAPLGQLRARWGTFFVTGNHEYYSGADEWLQHLPTLGVTPLRNQHVRVGSDEASFDLAGVDDWSAHLPGHGPNLAAALAGRDPARPLVLLAHQPKQVHEAAQRGVGLQLSGHTHGGQIWPFSFLVRLQQPYVAGLVKHGETQLYVSCGTGYWGPPMRLGAPAEITRIKLRAPT